MNEKFLKCLSFTLKWEGGVSNNPSDPGGLTNQGITQRTYDTYRRLKGLIQQSVLEMEDGERNNIYFEQYWIPSKSEEIEIKLSACQFDTSVNMGVSRANKFLSDCGNDPQRYIALREARYAELIIKNPKLKIFLGGWLNRTKALREFIKNV